MFKNFSLSGNIYFSAFLRLLLVMGLFTICRLGFFLFNTNFFPEMTLGNFLYLLWGGLKFDTVAVLYLNLLYILLIILPFNFRFNYGFQEVVKYIFFVTNGAGLGLNVFDFIYYKFTLRRTTADILQQFSNEEHMFKLFLQFVADYWYAFIFWLLIIITLVKLYQRFNYWGPQIKNKVVYYVGGTVFIPVIAFLIVVGIRGGIRHSVRPITLSNAGEYVKDPKHVSIVLNTPFSFIRTIGKTQVQKVNFYSENELEKIYTPIHSLNDTTQFKKDNVVVIILESFSKEFFGTFNKDKENGSYKGYTPFLDSLINHSVTFEYSFANGRKSIDGLPSVVASIPSLGVPYFLSPYSGDRINSLSSLLKEKGYHTSFFHGAPNGSMGFQAFMNLAGTDEYYGMTEYGNDDDFDGLWGIWDDKFFDFYAEKLKTFKQPFVSTIFSLSSHHPFKIPDGMEGKYPEGTLPIHKCVGYTDDALRNFFNKMKAMPGYENTLFVITADHTSSNIEYAENRTAWGFYSIPIIFFKPGDELVGRKKEIAQQIDIMPSVLGYLHYDKPFVGFGRDIFRERREPFAFNYKDNTYQLFSGDYLLVFDGLKSIGLYNFKTDKMIEHNLIQDRSELILKMEPLMKALIQQYNNRLIEDRLVVGK
jgi:phosphoglycerol transferase MdoB-like AlkP superfamily enzyme